MLCPAGRLVGGRVMVGGGRHLSGGDVVREQESNVAGTSRGTSGPRRRSLRGGGACGKARRAGPLRQVSGQPVDSPTGSWLATSASATRHATSFANRGSLRGHALKVRRRRRDHWRG